MQTLHVSNLKIQFDAPEGNNVLELVQNEIDAINEILQANFPNSQPQIFTSGIDNSDIESL